MMTSIEEYPDWDATDKKGSFMKINDMLMKEVGACGVCCITHDNDCASFRC